MDRSGYLQTSYAGVVECCDGVVNPLILLGLIAGMKTFKKKKDRCVERSRFSLSFYITHFLSHFKPMGSI